VQNGLITRFEEITDSGALMDAFAPADAERGKAYYTTCAACHGLHGEGNAGMHAPGLTVQRAEYLVRQLRNFRREIRGGVADFYGWQMNGRAKALAGDRAARDVVAYIDNFPPSIASPTIQGDAARGQVIYAGQCASCHGPAGEGDASVGSPPLAGLEDWYQLAQLTNYRTGTRGTDERDPWGMQMQPYALALNGEDAMQDVVAYIATLKGILRGP
jgi:cytochrome c553